MSAIAEKAQTLVRCLIGVVLIVAIIFKLRAPFVDELSSLALALDAALLIALICGAFDRVGDMFGTVGFLVLSGAGIVLTLNGRECGCFGAVNVPPLAPTVFSLAAACFCAVNGFRKADRGSPASKMKWFRLSAPAAVVLTLPWLAFGADSTSERERIAIDLIAHETSGETLDALVQLESARGWHEARAILFVSSSCSTCRELLQEITRRLPSSGSRWIAVVDLEPAADGGAATPTPFLPASARGKRRLHITTPAAALLRDGGRVERVFLGRADDVDGLTRFLLAGAPADAATFAKGAAR